MRYLTAFLALVAIIIGFFAGYKLGLFLFQERGITQINTRNNADESQTFAPIVSSQFQSPKSFCIDDINFLSEDDEKFCFQKSKLTEPRGIEVDLTNNKALLYDNEKLTKIFPLAYQSPENKWYQAPTGYYRVGVKHEKHLSSLFPVVMPYAIQFYEDFFIHGIPYYRDGKDVSSEFTGGCLRFANNFAKEIYDFVKTGDEIVVYKTFDDLEIKKDFHPPVDLENFWIRQRFNNSYRAFWNYGGTANLKFDYYQHTGVDFAANTTSSEKLSAYAIDDGKIAKVQLNDGNDHGLGNTIIIEHQIDNKKIYSLYSHLASIETLFKEGDIIKKGEIIGEVGNSGYGCQNYWRIGEDGCPSTGSGQANNNPDDIHLHFEIKKAPTLENPEGSGPYYGYTPDYPQGYGYIDPIQFLFDKL